MMTGLLNEQTSLQALKGPPPVSLVPAAMLSGLPAVCGPDSRLLLLGSFPGAASLAAQQYYAHPQNHFWKILGALWSQPLMAMPYQERLDFVRVRGLALWDVYAACERQGSLDSAIRHPVLNDFAGLPGRCPQLRGVAHNGGESFKHAAKVQALQLPVSRLPSSSAANASWSFERKLAAWHAVFAESGLL
jgi:hypoxanthine-DNA glycosylase